MAFLKAVEINETGITADYWRLTHIQFDRVAGVVEAQLHGYRDEAARRAGKAPLQRMGFRFEQTALDDPRRLEIDDLYRAIRAQPAGIGADGEALPALFAAAADI
ncbi:hypothetical protein [Roseococcus sp.]|uniref:hypothetical protein n=1 Tax=Roseococcus sp. TaxID=2109646 RepID=UPI003BAAEA13